MKKRLFAIVFALTVLVSTVSVSALEGDNLRATDALATLGLVQGNGTDYALQDPLTRAQAAVLLVRLAGAETAAKNDNWISGFRDVPAWAYTPITYAAHQGWINGVTVLDFKPNNPVTANAWCTMLLRMLGYSDKTGDFAVEDAAAFARRIGLVSRSYTDTMTRGDVFETMYDALTFPYKNGSGTIIARLAAQNSSVRASANALGLLNQRLTARQVADRHLAAVFCMDLYHSQESLVKREPDSNASGFFISADGLAVTNYHSIENAISAKATLVSGECYDVERVIYYDAEIDIAVIKVSTTAETGRTTSAFAYLELAGTKDIRAGDVVYALGNPLGLGLAISSGIIGSTAHEVERYALPCVVNSADISQGSSGGALLNEYGHVISVTSGAYVYGNSMFLSVPVDPVMAADLTAEGWTLEEVIKLETEKVSE